MTLNRASKKEADARLSLLRKQVSLHVFTLRFEDSACREARSAAEELAETTNRLSVEIDDAAECGDLLRKFRIDALPAIVAEAKNAPDLRLYGAPTGYGLIALLDALTAVGGNAEPRPDLFDAVSAAAGGGIRSSVHVDLIGSRRSAATVEAAAALWRVACADQAGGGHLRLVAALRLIEDFPLWSASAPPDAAREALPFLLLDGRAVLSWPFADTDIAAALGGA